MFIHDYSKRVRYGETDQMGYMYYGNYCQLYEIGRAEAIRSLGISYRDLEKKHHVMMPVVSVESRYRGAIHYDENIRIRTILKELPSRMIHFFHEIYNEKDILVHTGEVKLFFIDMQSNKKVNSPIYLNEKLKPYFEEQV